ncbi:hypothetical protein M9H77_05272 [Catharanthus roseus]|uniref:Uncharacterized protein n=1 Tax=Catharanthus roseus TaxID=4058 RepID=A0ACC0CGW1_CATRO|nr:hypothetical protein M9H77_05272 [Catharanthus roseus]
MLLETVVWIVRSTNLFTITLNFLIYCYSPQKLEIAERKRLSSSSPATAAVDRRSCRRKLARKQEKTKGRDTHLKPELGVGRSGSSSSSGSSRRAEDELREQRRRSLSSD